MRAMKPSHICAENNGTLDPSEPVGTSRYQVLTQLGHDDVDNQVLLDIHTVGHISLQVPGHWIRIWVDRCCGPRAWYPNGFRDNPITSLFDVIDWLSTPNFPYFMRYVEERLTNGERGWSDDQWFRKNLPLLTPEY